MCRKGQVTVFQFIGAAVIAAVLGFLGIIPLIGSLVLWGVVWLSTESFLGGMFIAALATGLLLFGVIPSIAIGGLVAVWTLLAWGFSG